MSDPRLPCHDSDSFDFHVTKGGFPHHQLDCRCDGDVTRQLTRQEFSSPRYSRNMNRVYERVRYGGKLAVLKALAPNGRVLTICLDPIDRACWRAKLPGSGYP